MKTFQVLCAGFLLGFSAWTLDGDFSQHNDIEHVTRFIIFRVIFHSFILLSYALCSQAHLSFDY